MGYDWNGIPNAYLISIITREKQSIVKFFLGGGGWGGGEEEIFNIVS